MIRDSKPILAEPTTQYDEILAALYVAQAMLEADSDTGIYANGKPFIDGVLKRVELTQQP